MSDQRADQQIDIPGVGPVVFPGSMTDQEIQAASTRLYQGANPGKKQPPVKSWIDTATDWLPTAGAAVGGILGAEAGPLGIAAGAGAGGALGKAVQQKVNVMRGTQEAPSTVTEALTPVAKEGAIDAGLSLAGAGAVKLARPLAGSAATALDRIGMSLEKIGASKLAKKGALLAAAEELYRSGPTGAAMAYGAPTAAKVAGRGLQAASRAMTGAPDAVGMVEQLFDAATRPANPITLSPWESNFVASVAQQAIDLGRPLSVSQKEVLKRIFAAKLKP